MTSGDIPAKSIEEAEYALSSANKNEADLVEFIERSIPLFNNAEPGSEESITHTAEEFQDLYDLPFNELGEQADEPAMVEPLAEKTQVSPVFMQYDFTNPNDYLTLSPSSFTQPIDYLSESDTVVKETTYTPVLSIDDSTDDNDTLSLMEALPSIENVLSRLISKLTTIGPVIYPEQSKQLLSTDQQYLPPLLMPRVLEMLVSPIVNSSFNLYVDPSNTPYLSSAPVTQFNSGEASTTIAAPGSVGTLIRDSKQQKILLQQFI